MAQQQRSVREQQPSPEDLRGDDSERGNSVIGGREGIVCIPGAGERRREESECSQDGGDGVSGVVLAREVETTVKAQPILK